jgi:electron transport complex protein RnfD
MWDVVIALTPAIFASIYFFGNNSIRILAISIITALVTELVMNIIMKRRITIFDGSAFITAILFAFNLPPSAPWYVVVGGSAFAIGIVKMAFGGLGYNILNPALGGRIFVMAAWSTAMVNRWSPTIRSLISRGDSFADASQKVVNAFPPEVISETVFITNETTGIISESISFSNNVVDMVSSASPLNSLKDLYSSAGVAVTNISEGVTNITEAIGTGAFANMRETFSYWDMFIGNIPGCIGETSALALLIGFVYLCIRKVIVPIIPLVYIATVALLAWVFGGLPLGGGLFSGDALYHILSGGLLLGAIFMATDYVTSPMSIKGSIIFAMCLGILTIIIRLWGGYPEGVSYSIVLMNIFVPIIDRYIKPKIYGRRNPKTEGAK